MRQSIDIIQGFTGKTPNGWLGPGRADVRHAGLCDRRGFRWFGDRVLDDQPFWVKTANGPILAIPD